jgi:Zn-dependent protease with chaperone function
MRFRRDREAAEATTSGLLLAFAVTLAALVVAVNLALALALRLTLPWPGAGYPALFFETNTAVVLLFVLGGCWLETLRLREGGAHVARLAGARQAEVEGSAPNGVLERRLVNVVCEMALASGTRPPAVWVMPRDQSINAFAAGWSAEDAVIAVTQGALERLTRAELQGLVGHEMGHLVSGDTRLHMRLIGLVWGLQMVYGFGTGLAGRDDLGRLRASAIVGAALVAVGYLGWIAGRLLQAAVGRQREFHADASAVQYTRTVDGIGGVLRKIAGLPALPRPRAPESLAHLWVAEAVDPDAPGWRRWLATHPPIALRLERLYGYRIDAMEAPLQPAQADEALPAMAAWAPATVAAPQPAPEAMHRATEAPQVCGDDGDEAGALHRAAYWHGRGERHAALLAWLIADDAELAPWSAWRERAGSAAFVERVREDWLRLRPAARQRVFDSLVARTVEAGAEDRRELLRCARGLARLGAARLRLLRLRHALAGTARLHGRQRLEDLTPALHAASLLLAQALGPKAAAWLSALRPTTGTAESASPRRAFALRRLHPMERPRVARGWVEAAAQAGLLHDAAATALLADACRLLDTPLPPPLVPR